MKLINRITRVGRFSALLILLFSAAAGYGQVTGDSSVVDTEKPAPAKPKPVKNTFESIWIIDNATVMVPVKGTFEMDIMHRFGTLETGYEDFYGFFAPSNIRLGFDYVPVSNLMLGLSIAKANMTWEGFAKYAIFRQTKGKSPVSVTYFGSMGVDTRTADNFYHNSDRYTFFNQLLIARKINDKLSIQIAPSVSHINVVNGYFKTSGSVADSNYESSVEGEMKHNHFALAISARYKLKPSMALLVDYNQPLTKHPTNNPHPSFAFGFEFNTSAHAFQLFVTNYYYIIPQRNNMFNQNNPASIKSFNDITLYPQNWLIGFNITRLWNW
jgi:hypothetical protein